MVSTLECTPLILHWDGTGWGRVTAVAPLDYGYLNAVSAASANDVWAAGQTNSRSLIAHWDGTRWSEVVSPNVEDLDALSVRGANDAWAAGTGGITHWDGATWSLSTTQFNNFN